MEFTIKHRCGHVTEFWAPSAGGYVRVVDSNHPGTLGRQPTWHGGSTLTCGPSEASLARQARRWLRWNRRHGWGPSCLYDTCDGVQAEEQRR